MNINKLLTAYVDEEITDSSELHEIKNLIETDTNIKFDYNVQVQTKKLIEDKLKINPAPDQVRKKIIRKIKPSKNIFKKLF